MIASASGARYLATWVDILGGQTMLATSLPPAGEGRTLAERHHRTDHDERRPKASRDCFS